MFLRQVNGLHTEGDIFAVMVFPRTCVVTLEKTLEQQKYEIK